jgi:5-methylcytosine-specific restriction enzyme subunit McrC
MLLAHGKAHCAFDELSVNTPANQVIRATIKYLAEVPSLDKALRGKLLAIYRDLPEIDPIRLSRLSFRKIQLHGNNRFYKFLLSVCELVVNSWLVDEETGNYRFRDFLRDDRRMAQVFESFIFNFFRIERADLDVRKEKIAWAVANPVAENVVYLPSMETDISLRSSQRTLIIDAKYYKETLSTYYESKSIHSSNLYQLFAYLKNLETRGEPDAKAAGMLLYPVVDQRLRLDYSIHGHSVSICTIDLSQGWQEIKKELLDLADERLN